MVAFIGGDGVTRRRREEEEVEAVKDSIQSGHQILCAAFLVSFSIKDHRGMEGGKGL